MRAGELISEWRDKTGLGLGAGLTKYIGVEEKIFNEYLELWALLWDRVIEAL